MKDNGYKCDGGACKDRFKKGSGAHIYKSVHERIGKDVKRTARRKDYDICDKCFDKFFLDSFIKWSEGTE